MNLVTWPASDYDGFGYRDSGEGGLFAYAVWPAQDGECSVDVRPQMPLADVLVSARGPLHEDFEDQRRSYHYDSKADYEVQMYRLQEEAGTVVFLGSTSASLHDEGNGYFEMTADSLTPEGLAVVTALSAAYGTEATFVTYLDT